MYRLSTNTQGIHRSIANRMTDPNWSSLYAQALINLQDGFYDPWWVSVIMQTDKRDPMTIFDAAVFIEVFTAIQNGQIIHTALPLGAMPGADQSVIRNNTQLPNGPYRALWTKPGEERKINVLFSSWASSGVAFTDGEIAYTGELPFFETKHGTTKTIWQKDQSFNLEVGACRSDQTWYGLAQARNLVRWPYLFDELVFMSVVDPDLWCTQLPPVPDSVTVSIETWGALPKKQLKLFEDAA